MILVYAIFYLMIKNTTATIDINSAELQYLADHLTTEECRRLVAAAHFQAYEQPNALDQAERKVPKDTTCIEHLHHWNSQEGEGKGQTHEALGHRLRQLGRVDLADWLGKTVFHQLGVDLKKSIEEDMTELTLYNESFAPVTLEPLTPEIENPTSFSAMDYVLYSLGIGLGLTILALCGKMAWSSCREKIRRRKYRKHKPYDFVETESSDSEYEENKFDVRTYTSSSRITR
ncbi:uncharacterized protein LOC126737645 isoform X2 [Anthonomus grandis grandis]|uniref:uncharacterized protein LOC126737645 isoform X2 n=1 Tax=Anthonomus grandis grandis TaxID=2921223 RepID=UPI0021665393|nr:uncharacterized protein LOC126737645 isoform X2 [Anthonomus grandis grandis]